MSTVDRFGAVKDFKGLVVGVRDLVGFNQTVPGIICACPRGIGLLALPCGGKDRR